MNTRTRTAVFVAAVAAGALIVAGCSNDDNQGHSMDSMDSMGSMSMTMSAQPSENSSDRNAADVMWTQMMIPHHQQAVEMAALAQGRTDNAELLELASQIQAAQDPEIEQMTGWLTAWGEPTMMNEGMDHSSMGTMGQMGDMGGMMTAEDMARLENSTGAEFDRAWLEMMIAHHQGAIDSSQQIQANGRSEQVDELAGKIISGQQAEIEQMKSMLGQ
ncbi:conserved exported hypothetical protein [Rhodococcus sp. RD6.2]|uniref:DUF305 domain-containing protein n=1 Tax=Rhodococcus sp. RD6.2 TaxID=260936 RepID=UPI00063B8CDE|nr:DUF305 domain-containing protein [Rhodococcus sp. RD6.2]CRK49865.1 conserved exported hypothetical protein [Rhodococcus sp. RD6.2]